MLMQVFNRGGFSSGHLANEYNTDLVYPKNQTIEDYIWDVYKNLIQIKVIFN